MDGDFKGDFTRDTFQPFKRYSRVLMQQGRVQLDADWNEQADILTYMLRKFAAAIIGPFGGPEKNLGFTIAKTNAANQEAGDGNFYIWPGDYYVDGILVENDDIGADGEPVFYTYTGQPYTTPAALSADNQDYQLVYLDVWEQQVTYLEDMLMREIALGEGRPDTAARARIMWQVGVMDAQRFNRDKKPTLAETTSMIAEIQGAEKVSSKADAIAQIAAQLVEILHPANRGMLRARAKQTAQDTSDSCNIPPDSKYRGDENQLYRVEIHNGGSVGGATFKWSRDNGSVAFLIKSIVTSDKTTTVTIGNLGRDAYLSVQEGDWVEIVDRGDVPQAQPHPLLKILKIDKNDPLSILVTLDGVIDHPENIHKENFPVLRRWDQRPKAAKQGSGPDRFDRKSGTLKVVEGSGEGGNDIKENWILLEDGVQVQFQQNGPPAAYRSGDYWLIPARAITGDVEWPLKNGQHASLPPHGVEHHYAPLAIFQLNANGNLDVLGDLRFVFESLAHPYK